MDSTTTTIIQITPGNQITPAQLSSAATLFSENYGTWPDGRRVKMSAKKLQHMLLPDLENEAHHYFVWANKERQRIGHVFATQWIHHGTSVMWITQLVVKKGQREQGLATAMLKKLRGSATPPTEIYGILSSQPAAIRAAARAFGGGLQSVNLTFAKCAAGIYMASCPVAYVRTAKVHGSLFFEQRNVHDGMEINDGAVSTAFTDFLVDHTEPLAAMEKIRKEDLKWPFGVLPRGHEFLLFGLTMI